MKKIGFFGGSFNPPTIAHFEIVELAIKEINLDKVVIIPMGDKYEKSGLIPFKFRYEMLIEMFKNKSDVEISNMQENQKIKTYAIDTFKAIDEKYKDSQNFFIMGIDNFNNIHNWKDSDYLLNNHKFIVFKRNNIELKKEFENVQYVDITKNISSSLARKSLKENKNIDNYLSKEIIEYINKNNLYKNYL